MGRPTIHDRPMTSTERSRRRRARAREGDTEPTMTNAEIAESKGISLGNLYHTKFVTKHGAPEWRDLIMEGDHDLSIAWVADVVKHANLGIQLEMIEVIDVKGRETALAAWKVLKRHPDLKIQLATREGFKVLKRDAGV